MPELEGVLMGLLNMDCEVIRNVLMHCCNVRYCLCTVYFHVFHYCKFSPVMRQT